jgi:hypothetical protein
MFLRVAFIDDRYWQRGRYLFLTDMPSSVPKLEHIAALSVNSGKQQPPGARASEIMALRNPHMFPHVPESAQIGTSITLDDAAARFTDAIELDSPMVSSPRWTELKSSSSITMTDVSVPSVFPDGQ